MLLVFAGNASDISLQNICCRRQMQLEIHEMLGLENGDVLGSKAPCAEKKSGILRGEDVYKC